MPDPVLESYISQFITAQDAPAISFAWQGGEPTLLGVDFFRKVVAIQKQVRQRQEDRERFSDQRRAAWTIDWGEFLAENHFLIGISIDGPAELHDFYRVDKGGAPTFHRVMRGLRFLKKHQVEFNALTVVNRQNSQHPLRVYRFLKGIGCQFMQFIPIVERVAKAAESARTGPDCATRPASRRGVRVVRRAAPVRRVP